MKILQTAIGVLFLVVLPLVGRIDLVFSWPVLVLTLGGAMIHMVPPYTPAQDLLKHNPSDRGSTYFMILTASGFSVLLLVDFAYFKQTIPMICSLWSILGLVAIVLGLLIRQWTVRALGSYFTARVTLEDEHEIVDHGPYRHLKVRHPAYLGTLLTTFGMPFIFRSQVGFLFYALALLPAYIYRIHIEESALKGKLGDRYANFSSRTWRLIPFIY